MEAASLEDLGEPTRPRGIVNLGNTCYVNACLQALVHCSPLTHYMRYGQALVRNKSETGTKSETGERLIFAFTETIRLLRDPTAPAGALRPDMLMEAVHMLQPQFAGHDQQDAHELLRILLDGMHEHMKRDLTKSEVLDVDAQRVVRWRDATGERFKHEARDAWENRERERHEKLAAGEAPPNPLPPPPWPSTSVVHHLFQGQLLSSVTCLSCRKVSHSLDFCLDLSLPLLANARNPKHVPNVRDGCDDAARSTAPPSNGHRVVNATPPPRKTARGGIGSWLSRSLNPFRGGGAPDRIQLTDCLAAFFSVEELGGEESYHCRACKAFHNCEKSLHLLHAPPIVAIHLKRFRFGGSAKKLADAVAFPLTNLDLSPYFPRGVCAAKAQYDLVGVVCHHGATMSCGHYTAYVYEARIRQWFHVDDSYSREVEPDEVLKAEAYILFYSRKLAVEHLEHSRRILERIRAFQQARACGALVDSLDGQAVRKQDSEDEVLLPRSWFSRFLYTDEPGPVTHHDVLCEHAAVDVSRCAQAPNVASPFGDKDRVALATHRILRDAFCVVPQGVHGSPSAVDAARDRYVVVPSSVFSELGRRFLVTSPMAPRVAYLVACRRCEENYNVTRRQQQAEKEEIQRCDSTDIQAGRLWFIIDAVWLKHWREFCFDGSRTDAPGPVCNWRLLNDGRPRQNLQRARHYRGVNEDVWGVFIRRYGGGPPICRHQLDIYADHVPPPLSSYL